MENMTFTTFQSFADWCKMMDGLTVKNIDLETKSLQIRDIQDTDPLLITEVLINAHDAGFTFGYFFAHELNGCLAICE